MSIKLDNFFDNPTLFSTIALIAFIIGNVAIVYFQNRNQKKQRDDNKTAATESVTAINNLSNKIQIFLDKEINTVNLQNAENIISDCSDYRIYKNVITRVEQK